MGQLLFLVRTLPQLQEGIVLTLRNFFQLMWWQYLLVFVGSFLVDVVPFPFPPAFTVMILLQLKFHLDMWWVIVLGVVGSVFGRYTLVMYIPHLSEHIFQQEKNDDIQFLGDRMKKRGWQTQLFILVYSLMPMPTTPLFLAGGMARMKPYYMIPAFFIGKFISDAATVFLGTYAGKKAVDIIHGLISWKSACGLALGIVLIFLLLFVDWKTLLTEKKLKFSFRIWKKKKNANSKSASSAE